MIPLSTIGSNLAQGQIYEIYIIERTTNVHITILHFVTSLNSYRCDIENISEQIWILLFKV